MRPHSPLSGSQHVENPITCVAAPLKLGPTGQLSLDDTAWRRIPVRLTSVAVVDGQNRYGFVQQQSDPFTGEYSDMPGVMPADGVNRYATEVNNTALTVPSSAPYLYVWLRYKSTVSSLPVYEFNAGQSSGGSGSGIALLDKTGSTVDSACVSAKMDTDGVLTVVNLSPGHDQFAVTDASTTQRGVVSLTSQTFAGNKTFNNTTTLGAVDQQTNVKGILTVGTLGLHSNTNLITLVSPDAFHIEFTDASGTTHIWAFGNDDSLDCPGGISAPGSCFLASNSGQDTTIGAGAIATSATAGFLYIPTCAGTPTGVPALAGFGVGVPMVYNTSANKLCVYNGGWKSSAVFT